MDTLEVVINRTSVVDGTKVLDFVDTDDFDADNGTGSFLPPTGSIVFDMDGNEGPLLSVAGNLTIDLFGFVSISGFFGFKTATGTFKVALNSTGGDATDFTTLTTDYLVVSGSGVEAFAGSGGGSGDATGVSLSNVDFTLALVKDAPNLVSYTALKASGSGGLSGVPGIDVSGDFFVNMNINSRLDTDPAYGDVIDFDSGGTIEGAPLGDIDFAGEGGRLFLVGANSIQLALFDVFYVDAGFTFEQKTVDVDVNGNGFFSTTEQDLDDASMLKFSLTVNQVFVGAPGSGSPFVPYNPASPDGRVGFNIGEGTVVFASIKANPTKITGDDRSFTAVKANFTGSIGLVGLPEGITITASQIGVALNGAAGTIPGVPTPINWVTSVNEAGNSGNNTSFISTPVEYRDGTNALIDTIGAGFETGITSISGTIELNIFDAVVGTASFDMSRRFVDVSFDGTADTPVINYNNASLLTLEITIQDVFIGVPGGIGFSVESGSLLLASLKPSTDPILNPSNYTRGYTAIVTSISGARLEGLPDAGTPDDYSDDPIQIEAVSLSFVSNSSSAGTPASPLALDWTTSIDLQPDDTTFDFDPVVVGSQTLDLTEEILSIGGELNLNILGYVTANALFQFEQKKVDVNVGPATWQVTTTTALATRDLKDAILVTLYLQINDLYIGVPDGIGFQVGGGTLALATIKPNADPLAANYDANDDRSWMALKASIDGAGLAGLPADFIIEATELFVEMNSVTSTNAPTAIALDWTTQVGNETAGVFTAAPVVIAPPPDADPLPDSITILFEGERTKIGGTITLDIFGFVKATASFDFVRSTVDVDIDGDGVIDTTKGDMDNANMITLSLSVSDLFIGIPPSGEPGDEGIGFSLDEGYLALAMIKSSNLADDRSYMAITASLSGAELLGIPGLVIKATELRLEINKASSATNPNLAALNWNTAVDLDASAPTFGADPVEIEFTNAPISVLPVTYNGTFLRLMADVTINIADFIYITGTIAVERKDLAAKVGTLPGTTTMTTLSIGASDVVAFVGVATDLNDDDVIDETEATAANGALGLSLGIPELALVLMKPVDPTGTNPSTKSYFALNATGTASLVGLEDVLAISGSLTLQVNSASDTNPLATQPVPTVDFAASAALNPDAYGSSDGLKVLTGLDPANDFIVIDYSASILRASGFVTITISEFVHVSGNFAFEKSSETVDMTLTTDPATTQKMSILKVGASNVNAFVGVGGPYFTDSNGDGVIDEDDTPLEEGAMGLALSNLEFGLALMKPDPVMYPGNTSSYYALKASGGVEVVGIDAVTIRADLLTVDINGGSDGNALTTNDPVINLDASAQAAADSPSTADDEIFGSPDGIRIFTGPDPEGPDPAPSVTLSYSDATLRAAGDVTLIIDGFVWASGEFAFSKEPTTAPNTIKLSTDGETTTTAPDAFNILTIGGNDINVFVGSGDPDSNEDGAFDDQDDPEGNGAKGLVLTNLDVALALLKPVATTPAPTTPPPSYYALSATATEIALVGIPGVTISATQIEVEINGTSVPSTGGSTPTGPPPPPPAAVHFVDSFPANSGLKVLTGPDPDGEGGEEAPFKIIDFTAPVLRASGAVELEFDFNTDGTPDFSLAVFIFFEQAYRANGTKAIKIALSDNDLDPETPNLILGDPADPIFDISIAEGLIFITNQGMAASFMLEAVSFDIGPVSVTGQLGFQINNIPTAINEEFVVNGADSDGEDNDGDGTIDEPGERVVLDLPAGPFLRLVGSVDISIVTGVSGVPDFTLSGDFTFEQITMQGSGIKAIRVGAANVSSTIVDPSSGNGISFSDGVGGFIIINNPTAGTTGIAGVMSLTTDIDLGFASAGGTVVLEMNNTGGAVDQTISVGGKNIAIKFSSTEGNVVRFAVLDASIEFPPFFSLTGDFTIQTVGSDTLYGARNVEIFLGYIPEGETLRDDAGNLNPDAIGLLVTNATLGMIERPSGAPAGGKLRAVYAYGNASLVGLEGLTITGSITVRISNLGQAVNQVIELPDDPAATLPLDADGEDNNGNGVTDEPGETASIRVKIDQSRIEEFSAGFDEFGQINDDSAVVISAAGIFTLSGAVKFTRSPTGRIDVDLPEATVDIAIPDGNGGLQPVVGVTGSAKFFFGGVEGFQLESLLVRGYSIFGNEATIPPAASSLIPPTADLASPFQNQLLDVENILEVGGVKYLAVTYNDLNRVGLNESSITDDGAEFLITATNSSGAPITISVDDTAVIKYTDINNDRTFLYPLTIDVGDTDFVTTAKVQVTFLANSWSDSQGKVNASEIETFTFYKNTKPVQEAPYATLANPFNGQTISKASLNAKRYIDVTFVSPTGALVDQSTLDGDEIKLLGPGTSNIDKNVSGFIIGSIQKISATTYRYFIQPKSGVALEETFVDGEVTVQFVANSWNVGTGSAAVANTSSTATFTVSAAAQDQAGATNNIALGPLTLEGPSLGIAKTGFKDGNLVLSVALGVNKAGLAFGGNQNGGSNSGGILAEVTGLVGTLDIHVDILAAINVITQGGDIGSVFSVPGKFRIDVAGLKIVVPNAFEVTGSGIVINYDPNYDAAANAGLPQELVIVQSATILFPSLGVAGVIAPSGATPGLTVYDNGFKLGQAMLIYDPDGGAIPSSSGTNTSALTQTSGGSGRKIAFGDILEFDDLRIGVTDFAVTFGEDLDFDGTIFIASGGARFLPGRPISATLSDRITAEPDLAPGLPDTEAVRASLEFENGEVKGFIFDVDTLRITLGSFLTLTATDLFIDTGADSDEEMVSFVAVGAEVTVGSLKIGGEARNFAFMGDGSFKPKAGFGVFLTIGSADGSSFKWPSWMPIKITKIGILWPGDTLQTDPTSFQLVLSAAVTGIQGMKGIEFSGAIEGVVIDMKLLKEGKFPIIAIESIGVSLKGDLFGGQITAGLIGGILRIDANGQIIDVLDTTTPVEDRIFFVGVEGGFSFSGVGGFTIRFAISELGPLGVFISGSVPGGILLEPNTGLAINDFSAGVEFFKTLPSIENPDELRGPEFGLPTGQSVDQWLSSVKQQVVAQYRAVKANPNLGGFLAAFTEPMLITGGAKIFTIYASKEVFNGEIIIRFSTDGKFLVIGKLNFAADNLSISGKLYADLSKIAAGEATVLFLADIPDQVQLLTIQGKLKMGFRNPQGQEAFFTVVDPQTGQPYARLDGPKDSGQIGRGAINGRGYIDIAFPADAGQIVKDGSPVTVTGTLNKDSILDLAPEFDLVSSTGATLDLTQAPVHIQGNTFRFWTNGDIEGGSVDIVYLKETWSYAASNGEELFSQLGKFEDADGVVQNDAPAPANHIVRRIASPYIDIRVVAAAGADVTDADMSLLATLGANALVTSITGRDENGNPLVNNPTILSGSAETNPVYLGNNTIRYFVDGNGAAAGDGFERGTYVVNFAGNTAANSALGTDLAVASNSFEVTMPAVSIAAPVTSGTASTTDTDLAGDTTGLDELAIIDVNVLNSQEDAGGYYIDITFKASPGSALDYASILDDTGGSAAEIKVWVIDQTGAGPYTPTLLTVAANPIPVDVSFDADFNLVTTEITADPGGTLEQKLIAEGITRFRYHLSDPPGGTFKPGQIVVETIGGSWQDAAGNAGPGGTWVFGVEGPTARMIAPTNGGTIDIGELNNRNFIDVTFPTPPTGYKIDPASILDLESEFDLSGEGLGNVKLDLGQAPVQMDVGVYRYWINGRFNSSDVKVEFIGQSWSFVPDAGVPTPPTVTTLTLDDPSFIGVAFDNIPAGYVLDPASITDTAAEFGLNYSGP